MHLVAKHTSIPLPVVRGCFPDRIGGMNFVMDYVEGDDLETIWPKLSLWKKLSIIWILRGYVQQLRAIPLANPDLPGPISPDATPVLCVGSQFGEYGAGPFDSYSSMTKWFEHKLLVTLDMETNLYHQKPDLKNLPHFDHFMPLVFTHADISMKNVRIGKDGKAARLGLRRRLSEMV